MQYESHFNIWNRVLTSVWKAKKQLRSQVKVRDYPHYTDCSAIQGASAVAQSTTITHILYVKTSDLNHALTVSITYWLDVRATDIARAAVFCNII